MAGIVVNSSLLSAQLQRAELAQRSGETAREARFKKPAGKPGEQLNTILDDKLADQSALQKQLRPQDRDIESGVKRGFADQDDVIEISTAALQAAAQSATGSEQVTDVAGQDDVALSGADQSRAAERSQPAPVREVPIPKREVRPGSVLDVTV